MPNYLVTARKWRPGLFEEIIGQGHVTRTLRNAVSSGRIAHAYIFSGPRGVGKTTAARILAKSLNCVKGPTPVPCNACEPCKAILAGSSMDVFEIDGASNNSVEDVRELRDGIAYMPSQGRYKVYIIDEVHMLSGAAFNALLKTLEEPPPHAVFIFATTEPHKVPLTILSRCQRFDFKRIPFREIQGHLKKILTEEGIEFEGSGLYAIARQADGSLRDAQSLLDQVIAFGGTVTEANVADALGLMDRNILFELLTAVVEKDSARCLNLVEKMHDFGYDLKRACVDLFEHIRDLTVVKVTGTGDLLELSDSEVESLKTLAGKTGIERLQMLFSVISRGYEEVSRSGFPRYSFEMSLLKAAHFDEAAPVSELIERLEKLTGRLNQAGVPGKEPLRASPGRIDTAMAAQKTSPQAVEAFSPATGPSVAEEETSGYGASPDTEALAGYIKQKLRPLSEPLSSAVIKVDGDTVSITVSADMCKVFEMKVDKLREISTEYFKRRMKVSILAGGAADKKAAVDPILKEAVKVFGGKVIEDFRRTDV